MGGVLVSEKYGKYYLSPRNVHLFGIQINYVLDEDEIIRKGPNYSRMQKYPPLPIRDTNE